MDVKRVILPFVAALCVTVTNVAVADEMLNGEQVKELFSGNTLHGAIAKYDISFDVFHASDGKILGNDSKGRTHTGKWSVNDEGELCQEWYAPSRWTTGCAKIVTLGNEMYSKQLPDGSAQYEFTVSEGDQR